MQRAMTKWTADIDKWQSKIEAIKEELECSDQRVRKLSEENRAHLRKLSKKEAEVIGMRNELSRLRPQMRDNFGEGVAKFEVMSDH
jgi:predicted  nucleic acid-binding Zn-ribbon protein